VQSTQWLTLEPGKLPELTLGMTDNPLPSENLLAFEPGSKKDKQLQKLFKEKGLTEDLGIPFSPKKDKQLQELMKEDQEQTDFPKTQLLKAADGGRVGLFMGGSPLEGEALSIYNSMSAYGNDDQTIADRLQALGMYTPGDSTPDAPDQGIINQQLNQGGGDGPKGDFGIFGNLLKDTAKEFNVQTYDEELGDFIDTKITGYKNVNSGLYQDKFGKNLQPAFSNKGQAFGLSGIIAQALGLTPDTVGGYVPGSIKGKYDGITDMFGSIKNFNLKNPFNFFKKQQATIADINAANLKAKQELDAKLAAEAAAAALQQQMQNTGVTGSNYNQAANIAGGGGGDTAKYGGQTAKEATYDNDKSTGTSQGYSQHYARGGLATMFTRRR